MERWFGEHITGRGAWGLLLIRLMAGSALILHGWPKIQHPFNWMPGGALPGPLLALSALAEFGGGLALVLGLLIPLVSVGLIINFLVAIWVGHLSHGDPYVSSQPHGSSWEAAAFYLAVGFLMLFTGPGALSLDAQLFGTNKLSVAPQLSTLNKE